VDQSSAEQAVTNEGTATEQKVSDNTVTNKTSEEITPAQQTQQQEQEQQQPQSVQQPTSEASPVQYPQQVVTTTDAEPQKNTPEVDVEAVSHQLSNLTPSPLTSNENYSYPYPAFIAQNPVAKFPQQNYPKFSYKPKPEQVKQHKSKSKTTPKRVQMSYYNYYPNYYAPNVQYAVVQQPMLSPMQQQVLAQQQQLVQQQQQQASIAQQQAMMAQQQQAMAQPQQQMVAQQQQPQQQQMPMMQQQAVVYQAQGPAVAVSQPSSQHPYPVLPNYSGQANAVSGANQRVEAPPPSPVVPALAEQRSWATTVEKFTLKEGKQEIHCADPLHDVESNTHTDNATTNEAVAKQGINR